VQITSGDIHNIDPLPVTAYATAYPTGHSVMFIPVNNEYSVGWRESLGLDTSINWYLIVEYFKTTSNNGYQKATAYRLGSNLPNAIFIRNSTGSTSWNNWKRIFTSDDITDSTTTDDSTKVASAKAVKVLNDSKLDKTGGVVTGNITINKGIPALVMSVPGRENDTRIFWNASTSSDFGLYFSVNGVYTLFLKSNKEILDGNSRPVYSGTSVTVSQTPPQGTLATDAIHMVY